MAHLGVPWVRAVVVHLLEVSSYDFDISRPHRSGPEVVKTPSCFVGLLCRTKESLVVQVARSLSEKSFIFSNSSISPTALDITT